MSKEEQCKYAEVCSVCCAKQIEDTEGCEFYALREDIDKILLGIQEYLKTAECKDLTFREVVEKYSKETNRAQKLEELTKFSQELGLYDNDPDLLERNFEVKTKQYVEKEKYDLLEQENKRLKENAKEQSNKLNLYFTCILKTGLILEQMSSKSWDGNVETIVQQAQEILNEAENTKDPIETLKGQIRFLENKVSHLRSIVKGYSKALDYIAED